MVTKRKTIFVITAKPNVFGARRQIKGFEKKKDANKFLKKLLSPPKKRTITIGGKKKTITLTSFRQGQSGTGINNPRIKKIKSFAGFG